MKNKIFVIFLFSTLFFSCSKQSDDKVDVGYDFYPYRVGSWVIYEVDSIFYDDFTGISDTFHFLLKEVFESEFIDEEGRRNLRLERYVKWNDSSDWVLRDVWYVHKNSMHVEKIEENIRFIRLIFPVRENESWDGNAMNSMNEQKYYYKNVDKFYAIDSVLSFDSTVVVVQNKIQNLLEEKDQFEVYARGVGLIYKNYKDVGKELTTGQIKKGLHYSWKIIQWKI
ncbi:MAG: hypothetical protein N2Z72_02760 [Bacteroidales bacterium]|nr:hypothetical protein [Bacteroidales bacterium]